MPTFELSGPDGGKYQVDAPDENAALSAFAQLHGGGKAANKVGLTDLVRSTASGVPIIGGFANNVDAAINAALAPAVEPFMTPGPETLTTEPDFAGRYAKSLKIQEERDRKFAEQHPIVDTAAKLTGGIAGMAPAVLAAPKLFGAAGTLPQMVRAGAGSGAAVSAADAAIRGEDVLPAAGVGAAVGAAAPLVARGIGAAVRAVRPAPAPVPQNVARVGTTDVPLFESQVTGNPAAGSEEQIIAKGARGAGPQTIAQQAIDAQEQAIRTASDEISAGLDPTGAKVGTTPHDAGNSVLAELSGAERTRALRETQAAARSASEADRVAQAISPTGVIHADTPYVAGETIGAGVQRARDTSRAATGGLYDAVRDTQGAFDPSVPRGLAADIRGRLNTGTDPVWVDPDTTSAANSALKLIDQTLGKGIFRNSAGPVGPVAEEIARGSGASAGATPAQSALAELTAMGVNPARARAAVADLPGGEALASGPPVMQPHSVALPSGASVNVVPKVVEARSLKTSADAGYNPELQPRNRDRVASQAQVRDMSANLNPERLGVSSEADRGAPIIGPDGMVESGNGRVMAVRKAYEEGGPAAQRYRAWLKSQGVDTAGMKHPVLVRERATPMTDAERKAFTVEANQSSTLSLSASERALADAKALSPETLSLIKNPSDLGSGENVGFIRAFMKDVPVSERAALMTADGQLSSEGLARVRNAVLGKAYGDTPVLSRIAESTNDEIKSISNALVSAAPEWAQLKAAIAAGHVPTELDATPHLLDAVARTAKLRGAGGGLRDALAQTDAFTKQTPESEAFMRMFYDADGKRAASSSQVSNALRHYAQEASKVDAAPSLGLGLAHVKAKDILENAAAKVGAPAEISKEVLAAAKETAAEATGPAIGLREMDQARKRLVTMFGDAKRAAMGPGGSASDVRAMGRILHEFDNAIIDAFDSGKFSGDSEAAKQLLKDARASHSAYRQTFTNRGGQDEIGRSIEKILGRHGDTAATPDEIARMSYGSASEPGGGKAEKLAARLRSILGATSPEWGAYKQGLFAHLRGAPGEHSPADIAYRIDRFLTGTTGKGLADEVFSAAERSQLASYANTLRAAEPATLKGANTVEKAVASLSGRDGSPPATSGQVVDLLYSRNGTGTKSFSAQLADHLKGQISPDAWTAIRQGMWSKLTNAGEGKIPFEAQALSQRLHEFLNESGKSLSEVLFTKAERDQMAALAKVYKQMIPVKGTTNPAGTAPMLAKIAAKGSNNLLSMLGLATHGMPGLAMGYAAGKALGKIAESRSAREATRLFYGPQRKPPVTVSRIPIVLGQGAAPAENRR